MSADSWQHCDKCGNEDCVRIDGLYDYDLNEDGTIKHYLSAMCIKCKFKWN